MVEDIAPRYTGQRELVTTSVSIYIADKKLHVHTYYKVTLTRGALRQTSQEAAATVAEAIVLLLAAILASVYCHHHRPIHSSNMCVKLSSFVINDYICCVNLKGRDCH